ncbi:MAG: EAL domain-containing protein [Desulforegulaceae bacterium]|nr:EAL domain-containing protein [Desulforegulaceae bacterium]
MKLKNISIGKKLLAIYLGLILLALTISSAFTVPLINGIIQSKINKELEGSIELFHSLVETAAEVSIKNHLKTIVSTNIEAIDFINTQSKSPYQNIIKQNKAIELLSRQTIGQTGYIYVIDLNGTIVMHPQKEMYKQNVFKFDFIQKKFESDENYLEYNWKNPDELKEREKALYFIHYKPWNWIVSAAAYKSEFNTLLKIEDLEKNIQSLKFGKTGYAFIMDTKGNFLIHPTLKGKNIDETNYAKTKETIENINKIKSGKIEALLDSKSGQSPKKKLIYFKFLEDYNLIICAVGCKTEIYSTTKMIFKIFGYTHLILIFLAIPILFFLRKSITQPLYLLTEKIKTATKGNLNVRLPYDSSDEIGRLSKYFNKFMEDLFEKKSSLEKEVEERKKSEEQAKMLAKFPDDNPNPVLRVDLQGNLTYLNKAALNIMEILSLKKGKQLPDFFTEKIKSAFETNLTQEIEFTDKDRIFSLTISPFKNINSAYIYIREETTHKAYESLMIMSEAFFQNSIEGICITDSDNKIVRINPFFTEITGYSKEEVIGKNPKFLNSGRHDKEFYKKMWYSINHIGQWTGEIWNRRKNGQPYPQLLSITAIRNKIGDVINYLGLFHDITESVLDKEKLHYQTYHDAITELPNRKLFTDITKQKINFNKKNQETFALLFIDLNNFKNINDALGHLAGDKILYLVAKRLRASIPEQIVIARFVGDKFLILAPEAHNQNAVIKKASKIQKIIEGPYKIDEREILLGSNIGIAFFPEDGNSAETLIKNAEMAMYRGKNKGKRTISFFTQSMDESAAKQLETEQNLAHALSNNEFELYYQPKVSLLTGKITGAEALIRWIKNGQVISPALFIPIAEDNGHIIPIGKWVMEKAVAELGFWHKSGFKDLHVSVNLSGAQFHDPELIEKITDIFAKTGSDPKFVNFEITESVVMSDPELAEETTKRIKEMGSKIAIDDFGTGYSSLGYLKKFPIDELKIDKSFLDDFPDSNEDVSIIKSILSLASNLNLKVTAEGVERKTQIDVLKTLDCDEIQGYYFSRPVPAKDFYSLIKSGKKLFDK